MLFRKKRPRELEELVNQIQVDLANNYKDNAVEGIQKLKTVLEQKKSTSSVKDSDYSYYQEKIRTFEEDVRGFKRTY